VQNHQTAIAAILQGYLRNQRRWQVVMVITQFEIAHSTVTACRRI
jgi:hypothetical protein